MSSSSKSIEKAKVTFEYEADNEDELTIKVGDMVEIVNKDTDNDGWWEVGDVLRCHGYQAYLGCRGTLTGR